MDVEHHVYLLWIGRPDKGRTSTGWQAASSGVTCRKIISRKVVVSRFGPAGRRYAGKRTTSVRFPVSGCSLSSTGQVYGHCLVTLALTVTEIALIAAHLNAEFFGGDRVALGIVSSPLIPVISVPASTSIEIPRR